MNKYLGTEFLGHITKLHLTFSVIDNLFSKISLSFYTHIAIYESSVSLHLHLSFDNSHSIVYEVVCHCGFNLSFPMINDVKHLMVLNMHLYIFGEMSIEILCIYFSWVVLWHYKNLLLILLEFFDMNCEFTNNKSITLHNILNVWQECSEWCYSIQFISLTFYWVPIVCYKYYLYVLEIQ